jgi:hypothetical protein
MITLEVVLGVALLLGWRTKMVSWLLLLLILFFTFLTSYVLFSGKIRACGCFGDCIPLTPGQTFTKDIVLLVLVLIILFGRKYIKPIFSNKINVTFFLVSFFGVLGLQWYVLHHLPLKDCLPYKVGNNIFELRKMPKDAIPDKFDYIFVYQKNGEKKEFAVTALPDSSWEFAERKQVLVEKGKNNVPLINDFIFNTESGNDTTEAILNQSGEYYLLFAKDFHEGDLRWIKDFELFYTKKVGINNAYVVTSDPKTAKELINIPNTHVFTCDATAIKTAARVNPTLFLMKGPVVKGKWAAKDKF